MSGKKKRGTTGTFTVHFDVSEDVFFVLTQIANQTRRTTNETASVIVHDWLTAVARHVSPDMGSPKMPKIDTNSGDIGKKDNP